MNRFLVCLVFFVFLGQSQFCSDISGRAKGLCNAFCEAMRCHNPDAMNAAPKACDTVKSNYRAAVGDPSAKLPCEVDTTVCLCAETWENGIAAIPPPDNTALPSTENFANNECELRVITVDPGAAYDLSVGAINELVCKDFDFQMDPQMPPETVTIFVDPLLNSTFAEEKQKCVTYLETVAPGLNITSDVTGCIPSW